MLRKTKSFISIFIVVAMAVAFSACGSSPDASETGAPATTAPATTAAPAEKDAPETGDKPYAGTTLTLTTGVAETMEAIKQDFFDATGITLEISAMSSNDLNTKYALEAASRTGSIDVMGTNYQWHASFITDQSSLYLPIEKYMNNTNYPQIPWDQYSKDAIEAYSKYKGVYYGVPFIADIYLFAYNNQMYKQAGLDPAKAPTTWNEVIENAKTIQSKIPGVYGFTVNANRDVQIGTTYTQILFSLGGAWINDAMDTATLNTPEAKKALEIFTELYKLSPPESTSYGAVETAQAFASGKVAQIINWPGTYAPNFTDQYLKIDRSAITYATSPGGNSILGGWAYFINNYSKNQDAAYEFQAWFSGSDVQKKYALAGGASANLITCQDADVIAKYPYVPAVSTSLASCKPYPVTKATSGLRSMTTEELNDYITGVIDADTCLANMQKRAQDLLDEANGK